MAAPKIPDDIRTYMVGTLGLTDVTVYGLSPTPINQYSIAEYPGPMNTHVHGGLVTGNDIAFDEAMIQIASRHRTLQTARDNLKTVVDALDGLMDTTINSVVYTYITRTSPIRLFERQEDGSAIFITEFRVQARRG